MVDFGKFANNVAGRYSNPDNYKTDYTKRRITFNIPGDLNISDQDSEIIMALFQAIHRVKENTKAKVEERTKPTPSQEKVNKCKDLISYLFDIQDKLEENLSDEEFNEIETYMMEINQL